MTWDSTIAAMQSFAPPDEVIEYAGQTIEEVSVDTPYDPWIELRTHDTGFFETRRNGTGFTIVPEWASWSSKAPDSLTAGDYEIFLSYDSGDGAHPLAGSSDPLDTWIVLSDEPIWRWEGGVVLGQEDTAFYEMTVRKVSDMVQQFQNLITIIMAKQTS